VAQDHEGSDLPPLTREIVEDDVALAEAVDVVILMDPEASRRAAALLEQLEDLHVMLDHGQWQAFLTLEASINERWAELALVIARWAYNEGLRSAPPG
jgi:hypothetical protein